MTADILPFKPKKPSLSTRFEQAVMMIDQFDSESYRDADFIARESLLIELAEKMGKIIDEPKHSFKFEEVVINSLRPAFNRLYLDDNIIPSQSSIDEHISTLKVSIVLKLGQKASALGLSLT